MKEKDPSAMLLSEIFQPPSPQHDTNDEKEEEPPLFNQPQNKNNPKKHCCPCALFNVLAERK